VAMVLRLERAIALPSSTDTSPEPSFATASPVAIAVEIATATDMRIGARSKVLCRLEGPLAVAQQHGDIVGAFVGHHQVSLPSPLKSPMATEIGRVPALRAVPWKSIAVAQEHGDSAGFRWRLPGRTPSPLKSPTATKIGSYPAVKSLLATTIPSVRRCARKRH